MDRVQNIISTGRKRSLYALVSVLVLCDATLLPTSSHAQRIARADVNRFLATVAFDIPKRKLRSSALLDYQLVENPPSDFEEALHSPTRRPEQICLYVHKASVFDVEEGTLALIQLDDVFGYGGVGGFLSLWDAQKDSLSFRCVGEAIFGDSYGSTELIASRTVEDAIYVLSIFRAGDDGDWWGALRVHKVGSNCRHELSFEETWEAQYVDVTGGPIVEYEFLEADSTDRRFAVDRREFMFRRDESGRETKVPSASRRLAIDVSE